MGTQIEIKLTNGIDIQLMSIMRPNDIADAVQQIETALYTMFEHHVEQILYQREYKIADSDIVADFNGDSLYMAMGIRMKDEDEMFAACGLSPELYIHMDEGRVKPSHKHLEQIAKYLQFPIGFFTRERDPIDREFKNTFICYAHDYGDD